MAQARQRKTKTASTGRSAGKLPVFSPESKAHPAAGAVNHAAPAHPDSQLTKQEIKEQLRGLGVDFDGRASRVALAVLLAGANRGDSG